MSLSIPQPAPGAIASMAVVALSVGGPCTAVASPAPTYDEVEAYETIIPATNDPADIYYPVPPANADPVQFPLALMLQGAFVDKSAYSDFARAVASYGFVVVVPNHERSLVNPRTGEPVVGFAPEQRQVHDVLDFVEMQETDPTSPIAGRVDPERFALLGHSIGGYVAISAIRGSCLPLICTGDRFQPPPQLDVGVFYGTTFEAQARDGTFPPIENLIPIALIAGSEDGEANYERVVLTYEQIQNPPRALILVEGANHYSITNENSDRAINPPLLEQSEAIATIAHWTGQFLRAHLWEDTTAFEAVYGEDNDADETVTITGQSGTAID